MTQQNTENRRLIITTALPYANGPLHMGHLLEHIQSDIWARFQKMQGHECIFLCGDDAHGTPIMLKAAALDKTPEALIAEIKQSHENDFKAFHIDYDTYHTTHSPENQSLANLIYERLKKHGHISSKVIKQAFDPEKAMFLPDRYVKGNCPRCDSADQYGDSCEVCGATYSPTELKSPRSVLSGSTPIEKESRHLFFELKHFQAILKEWLMQETLQTEVRNKLLEWFESGLQAWDISRDAPYFGFEIPEEKDKYFYVWLDAPVGYLASFKKFCQTQDTNVDFDEWLSPSGSTELYHFIGKDIIYFHGLFWPAMLHGAQMKQPSAIFAHGFLTINGQKMSKSRGTFITAEAYRNQLDTEYLRYYFAAKLNANIEDIDLNFEDFKLRVNADLIGKVVNIASRAAKFINKKFNHQLSKKLDNETLLDHAAAQSRNIAALYEKREFAKAVRVIMELADEANQYIDARKPWLMIKDPAELNETHAVCSTALNLFRLLILYLKPILPKLAENTEKFLMITPLTWSDSEVRLQDHTINQFTPLMTRVEDTAINALLEKNV